MKRMVLSYECAIMFVFVQIAIMWFSFKHKALKSDVWSIPPIKYIRCVPIFTFLWTMLFLCVTNLLFGIACFLFINSTSENSTRHGYMMTGGWNMVITFTALMCMSFVASTAIVTLYLMIKDEKTALTWEDICAIYTCLVAVLLFMMIGAGLSKRTK